MWKKFRIYSFFFLNFVARIDNSVNTLYINITKLYQ